MQALNTNKQEMTKKLIDNDDDIARASLAIKAIAHPLRLKVMCLLAGNELSVQELVDSIGTSQANISQHLAILRNRRVLVTQKVGNRVYYRIGDPRTLRFVSMVGDVFCK